MSHLLLVHGAWQGAWIWKALISELRRQGHEAFAFDLPGSGEDRTPRASVSLDLYADAVIDQARRIGTDNIVLVGHSMGGAVITAAAKKAPELFSQLIYLCAFLPQDGQSAQQLSQLGHSDGFEGPVAVPTEDGLALRLVPDHIVGTFLNDCEPIAAAEWARLFLPQPIAPLAAKAVGSLPETLSRAYVVCALDRAIPPALQHKMAEASDCHPIWTIQSGHEPFLSMPQSLSQLLCDFRAR